jgi:hypothetical protein
MKNTILHQSQDFNRTALEDFASFNQDLFLCLFFLRDRYLPKIDCTNLQQLKTQVEG